MRAEAVAGRICWSRRSTLAAGLLSRKINLVMIFKPVKPAKRHRRKLDGANRLGQLIECVRFRNGEPIPVAAD